jgi:hypothetical protein
VALCPSLLVCYCWYSWLLPQPYSWEENEGTELLGRAGDGLFKRERYLTHILLHEAQVAVVITDVAILCVSIAPESYYAVHWRVHFKGRCACGV